MLTYERGIKKAAAYAAVDDEYGRQPIRAGMMKGLCDTLTIGTNRSKYRKSRILWLFLPNHSVTPAIWMLREPVTLNLFHSFEGNNNFNKNIERRKMNVKI